MNFTHFLGLFREERIDPVIVFNLHQDLAAAMGAKVTRVLLSRETLAKQKRRHGELTEADYRLVRPALQFGEYRQETPRTLMVLFVDTKLTTKNYRIHLKATGNGKEIYLDSLCILGRRQHRAELRRGLPIIREHLSI